MASNPEWQDRVRAEGASSLREGILDMEFGPIFVPKGVSGWTLIVTLHQDPEIWGPDADKFSPERFANE